MTIHLQLLLAAAALAEASSPAAAPSAPVVSLAEKPEIVAAKANRSRIKVAPMIRDKNYPEWYARERDAFRALGEHGTASVEGIIGENGRYSELRIRTSSRGAHLDAFVMKVAATLNFTPAKDATGALIATWEQFPLEFKAASFEQDSSIVRYRCDAVVRDFDWWRGAWPELGEGNYELRNFATGMALLMNARRRGGPRANEASMANFPERWEQALRDCRNMPTQLFVDAFGLRPPADAVGATRQRRSRK